MLVLYSVNETGEQQISCSVWLKMIQSETIFNLVYGLGVKLDELQEREQSVSTTLLLLQRCLDHF